RAFKYVFEPAVALLAIRNTDVEPKAEDVMVPVVLDYHGTSAEGISVLVFAISFDTNIVTVRDVVLGESAQSAGKNIHMYLGDDGLIRVAVSGGTSVIEQGVVCLLDISLDIGSRRGMGTKLRFEEVSASSPDGYELQLDTRPGVIRVGRSYDCNSDGAVDAIDIQHVINFALKAATGLDDIAAEIADGDLDGDIDAVDIQMVINKTLGL
ncbi:MAG: hypothetical protein J7M12_01475, partial [Candidatus Hydrogenedentes bacterium]|nr:hypothetical protein [Candidatus Hydrogenedentota bacterium]